MTFDDITVAFGIQTDTINNLVSPYSSMINADSFKVSIRTDISTQHKERRFGSLSFFMATTDSSDYYMPLLEHLYFII